MTYAPDPTYENPLDGWTIQKFHPHMDTSPVRSKDKLDGPPVQASIEIIGPVEVIMDPAPPPRTRRTTPRPRSRRR